MIDPLLVQGLIIIYLFIQLVIFTNFLIKKVFQFIIKFFKKRGTQPKSSPLKQVTELDNNTLSPVVKEELEEANSIDNSQEKERIPRFEPFPTSFKEDDYSNLSKEVKDENTPK